MLLYLLVRGAPVVQNDQVLAWAPNNQNIKFNLQYIFYP